MRHVLISAHAESVSNFSRANAEAFALLDQPISEKISETNGNKRKFMAILGKFQKKAEISGKN